VRGARPNINRYGVDRLPIVAVWCSLWRTTPSNLTSWSLKRGPASAKAGAALGPVARSGGNECEYHLAVTYRCRADAAGGLGDRRIVYNLPIVSTAAAVARRLGRNVGFGTVWSVVHELGRILNLVRVRLPHLDVILILLGARRLPDIVEQWQNKRSDGGAKSPVLLALTFILGAASLILVLYEFSK